MHTALQDAPAQRLRWYQGMKGYHWWVLVVGSLAWLLDTMSQRIFILARSPALQELMNSASDVEVRKFGTYATAAMMVGWAVGGFYFGIVGDRWGRAKTLSASILVYSIFTGISGLSTSWWDFCIWRFAMGCGIGGAFATAATLIAETVPSHSRAFALGMFQSLSALGNILASGIAWLVILPQSRYLGGFVEGGVSGWRLLFFVGVIPALLVLPIIATIREPQAWLDAREKASDKLQKQMGDIRGMFTDARWRRSTLVGMGLAVAGVVGLWGVGFWSPELVNVALKPTGASKQYIGQVIARGTLLQDVGAFFGMFVFTILATRFGRKIGFGLAFATAFVVVSTVFLTLRSEMQVYILLPLVGFVTLSVFGGYSIYFPEIYPTRLRSTGTALCYNSARIGTAVVILLGGGMQVLLQNLNSPDAFRWCMVILCGFYLLGLVVLVWAPETKDKPLPEE